MRERIEGEEGRRAEKNITIKTIKNEKNHILLLLKINK